LQKKFKQKDALNSRKVRIYCEAWWIGLSYLKRGRVGPNDSTQRI
jgi:hypothetical protein